MGAHGVYSLAVLLTVYMFSAVASNCPHTDPGLSLWSTDSNLPRPGNINPGDKITISTRVLLDNTLPPFHALEIAPSGQLVVSPDVKVKLEVDYILIEGRMDVGSEDCPFDGSFEVVLTGKRGAYNIPGFGEKFIGVKAGGTLEVHGKRKLAWTKLSQTVPKLNSSDYIYKHSEAGHHKQDWQEGVGVTVVNPAQVSSKTYKVYYLSGEKSRMRQVNQAMIDFPKDIAAIADGRIVLISVVKTMKNPTSTTNMDAIYDAFERTFFGAVTGNSIFRTLGHRDAYVMTAVKGDPSSVREKVSRFVQGEKDHTVTLDYADYSNRKMYSVKSFIDNTNKWGSVPDFTIVDLDKVYPVINVIDRVPSWEEGDEVVFTSTDYDMDQAERGRIVRCDTCSQYQFRVNLEFKFTHFGEIESRVDMRGEVALLTRNVKVRGQMENSCPEENGNCGSCPKGWIGKNCGKYPYDTFGGHVKFLKGFANVHVEGVELENMGQQTALGHYPLHFHMCEDVSGYANPPYLKDNSIHDTFARCITIHGTHGVLVQDNVGYNVLGHCFFLEDGGEKNTVFDGNLGAVIKKARLIPADDKPTVFWITNPLVTLVNNVAAGSDHTGYWFIFPKEPIQGSKGKGFMSHASSTAITKMENNVVHSSFVTGLNLDDVLSPDNEILTGHDPLYEAHTDPSNPKSPVKLVTFDKITAYKNRFNNIWIRASYIEVTRSSLSDSAVGITLIRTKDREAYMSDSVLLGDSKRNLGEPSVKWDGRANKWVQFPRSMPMDWDEKWPRQGFVFYVGPTFATNLWFNGFKTTNSSTSGAISFQRKNKFWTAPISSVKNVQFGFDDSPETGNFVFDGTKDDYEYDNLDGDKGATFIWEDNNEQIVKPSPVFVTKAKCVLRENWNMASCKHKYAKLNVVVTKPGGPKPGLEMRRDDIPNEKETLVGTHTGQFLTILGGTHSYSLHWKGKVPQQFLIFGDGVEKNLPVRLAICLPKNADFDMLSWSPRWRPNRRSWRRVNTPEEVDRSNDGGSYMYDAKTGLLFVKFVSNKARKPTTKSLCEGHCPVFMITVKSGDRNQGNCVSSMYPKYQRFPATMSGTLNKYTPVLPKTSVEPPQTFGVGETRPFSSRVIDVPGPEFSSWTKWTACSVTCGVGTQTRSRQCLRTTCGGYTTESRSCSTQTCAAPTTPAPTTAAPTTPAPTTPVPTTAAPTTPAPTTAAPTTVPPVSITDCVWSEWVACTSTTCQGGSETRTRVCTNPTATGVCVAQARGAVLPS